MPAARRISANTETFTAGLPEQTPAMPSKCISSTVMPLVSGRPAPPLIILGTVALYMLSSSQSGEQAGDYMDAGGDLPRHAARLQPPPLRGCRGAPTEFRWVLEDGGTADAAGAPLRTAAGVTLRTKVLALDAQGRRARASACSGLAVSVSLGGRARLSENSSHMSWRDGELPLDIEDTTAELVDVELRIENRGEGPDANSTERLARVNFTAGPPRGFLLQLRPASSGAARASRPPVNASGTRWSTRIVLEAVLSARDRFDNEVLASDLIRDDYGLRLAGSHSLELLAGGRLALSEDGKARALLRGSHPGSAELWLQQAESSEGLQGRTAVHLDFIDPPAGVALVTDAGHAADARRLSAHDAEWQPVAAEVRDAFLHAWRGYRRFAWGTDELQPVSKKGRDSFGNIGMTVLDSLTTLHLMGLHEEFEQGADFVRKHLDFDSADREVSVFELTIRALGGLLGAHSLTGRPIFLQRARELADRLLPALNSTSGLPMPRWNIARQGGTATGEPTVLAEAGSLQLEFRYLTAATGDLRYGRAADACFDAIQATNVVGLMPVQLTPPDQSPPRVVASRYAMGALADSYYEYLLKQWLQNPAEERFKGIWISVMEQLPALIRPKPTPEKASKRAPQYKLVEANAGGGTIYKMDHLSCFVPGMIALGLLTLPPADLDEGRNATWHQLAEGLTASCTELWTSTKSGLAPEYALLSSGPPFSISQIPGGARHSFLRPETAESLFYLYRLTGKNKYRKWGKKLFDAIVTNGKVDAGFASVADVQHVPTEKLDDMQSFVMAETFKYLYLLFSPNDVLDLDKYVLNTEAHPLRRPGPF